MVSAVTPPAKAASQHSSQGQGYFLGKQLGGAAAGQSSKTSVLSAKQASCSKEPCEEENPAVAAWLLRENE